MNSRMEWYGLAMLFMSVFLKITMGVYHEK